MIAQNNLLLVTTSRQYFGPVDIQKMQIHKKKKIEVVMLLMKILNF